MCDITGRQWGTGDVDDYMTVLMVILNRGAISAVLFCRIIWVGHSFPERCMIKSCLLLLLIMSLAGCASYNVSVDSISGRESGTGGTYYLVSGLKDVDSSDLQFQEYAGYIDCAMAESGFARSKDSNYADIAVFLSYGIGDPKESVGSYAIPIYGQTGVSSAYTTGSVNSYGQNAYYSGTTSFTPEYGIKGFATGVRSYTTYYRYFLLDAFDLKSYRERNNKIQLWSTKATSSGSSGDLRTVFPVMVGAAKKYFGKNTEKQLSFAMYDWSPEVKSVKCAGVNGAQPPAVATKTVPASTHSVSNAGVDKKIYLKDGSVLIGKSINFDSGNIILQSPMGSLKIPAEDVIKIE